MNQNFEKPIQKQPKSTSPINKLTCIICHRKLSMGTEKHTCTSRVTSQKLVIQSVILE